MGQIDFYVIEQNVKASLTEQIMEKELKEQLELHMTSKVNDIVTQYKELEQRWNEIGAAEAENLNKYQGLTVKQMLKAIMENLSTESGRKELWKNSAPEDSEKLQDLNMNINLQTGDIKIVSKTMEPDGEFPLFEWDLNTNTGVIEEITRKDNKERIVERMEQRPTVV